MKKQKEIVRFKQILVGQGTQKSELGYDTHPASELFGVDDLGRVWHYRTSMGSPNLRKWFLTEFDAKRQFQMAEEAEQSELNAAAS